MSAEEVANAFVPHYYQQLDSNPDNLSMLYMPTSMMTFESNQVQGSEAILQKLKSVGRLSHSVQTIDVQPSYSENCILVYVTGTVSIDGGNALHFGEMFQLVASAPGQYYVHNDVFRLNFGL